MGMYSSYTGESMYNFGKPWSTFAVDPQYLKVKNAKFDKRSYQKLLDLY